MPYFCFGEHLSPMGNPVEQMMLYEAALTVSCACHILAPFGRDKPRILKIKHKLTRSTCVDAAEARGMIATLHTGYNPALL